jgi:hypothetical protein
VGRLPEICEIVFLKFSVIMPQNRVAAIMRAIRGAVSGNEDEVAKTPE